MTPDQAAGILAYINQIDPLVPINDANAHVWWAALEHRDMAKAHWCITDYYANTHPGRDGRVPCLTPALLRQRISAKSEQVDAQQRALAGPARHTSPESFKARDPERWAQLVQQGSDLYRADLHARGITPHAEACPDCAANEKRRQRKAAA